MNARELDAMLPTTPLTTATEPAVEDVQNALQILTGATRTALGNRFITAVEYERTIARLENAIRKLGHS